jgi:hypothetical protein
MYNIEYLIKTIEAQQEKSHHVRKSRETEEIAKSSIVNKIISYRP